MDVSHILKTAAIVLIIMAVANRIAPIKALVDPS